MLRPFRAAAASPHHLLQGDTVWFLSLDSLESLKDAGFAAEVREALAGTLKIRYVAVIHFSSSWIVASARIQYLQMAPE